MTGGGTKTAAWLSGVFLFLIAYGSLYPFRFSDIGATGAGDLFGRLHWARTTPSDIAANLLLYLPLGASLAWLLAARLGQLLAILAATLAGLLLAGTIELAQLYETRRVASLADLCLNTVGAAAGAVLAMLVAAAQRRLHGGTFATALRHPIAVALLLSWLGHRLAPFAPDLSLDGMLASFRALLETPWWAPLETGRHALAWLVIVLAAARCARPERALVLAGGAMLVVLAGRVLFARLGLVPAESLGMAAALLLARGLLALPARGAAAALAALLVAWLAIAGLTPFDFRLTGEGFALLPFAESLIHYRAANLADLFSRCFFAGALVWLLVQGGLPVLTATILGTSTVFAIELLQTWLPGRTADITDPLLALAAGGLVALFESDREARG